MGKVVLSSEDEMEEETELQVVHEGRDKKRRNTGEGGGGGGADVPAVAVAVAGTSSSSVVEWERFLPKMVLRVLLVEADDSTRQIIAALLRKCSYRVAAVGDGLKAWEVLKARPQNIDLILTEVELPSISGYALLTLIMEHDVCKNIPVIMMSSQDSISTVYKCMLRGAADFLVKPVRKNELKNLWQHFWRKQASSSVGIEPPDESVAQQKVEATSENKANSNHSSGSMACIQRNKEQVEKGSDAQSSCTKPELSTEETDMEQDHGLAQTIIPKQVSNDIRIPTQEECHQERRKTQAHAHENDTRGNVLTGLEVNASGGQNSENKIENFSIEAIDLIGAFDNYGKSTFGSSALNASTIKLDSLPHLDLSLRRCNTSGPVNQVDDEHRLNHSDSSAFHRYIHKRLCVSPSNCSQQKDNEPISDKKLSSHTPDLISVPHGPTLSSQKHVSVATVQPGTSKFAFPYPQQKESSVPIPVKGIRFENTTNAYEFIMPTIYRAQPGLSPLPSPGTAGTVNHSESFHQMNKFCPSDHPPSSSQQLHNHMDQTPDSVIDPSDDKYDQKLEDLEDGGNLSPVNDQSANSSFCNGNMSHHYSTGYGINSKINEISVVKATSECGNDQEGFNVYEGSSHRSIQREAALTKFRLKRKDRCFEKKVRYESRKKLAEQRPRVKGQFVRQVLGDPHPGDSSTG